VATMLGNVALTLLTVLLLQLMLAVAWRVSSRLLGLSRRASRHWIISTLLCALSVALVLARGWVPDVLGVVLSSVLAVTAVLAIRRGALAFLKQSAYDGEAILVLVAVGGAGLGCLAWSSPMAAATQVLINSTGMAWVLGRTAWQIYGPLRTEFGDGTAYMLVATFVAGVALFAARAVAGLVPGAPPLTPFPTDSPANIAAAVLMLLLTLSLHGSLVLMVMNRLVRRLRHLSQRDPLTGLFNRAEWTRQLEAHHRWLGRYGDAFGVLMVDIDHFKKINDTMGHAAGDAVLITVAQVLTASSRDVDVIGRLGGEEFGVLLPRADAITMRRTGERLRQLLGEAQTTWREQPIRVTVSVGAALCADPDETPSMLYERADRALYQAKHTGRNRTVLSRLAG